MIFMYMQTFNKILSSNQVKFVLLCMFLINAMRVYSQVPRLFGNEGMVVYKDSLGKYGFKNNSGEIIIPCKYDYVYDFYCGLACVNKAGKYGYIDTTGKEVIPLIYDIAYNFSEGCASVEKDGQRGIIDKTGRPITPFKYYIAGSFSEGLASVWKNERVVSFVDKSGKEVLGKYKNSLKGELGISIYFFHYFLKDWLL